jgi:hypothetical protein
MPDSASDAILPAYLPGAVYGSSPHIASLAVPVTPTPAPVDENDFSSRPLAVGDSPLLRIQEVSETATHTFLENVAGMPLRRLVQVQHDQNIFAKSEGVLDFALRAANLDQSCLAELNGQALVRVELHRGMWMTPEVRSREIAILHASAFAPKRVFSTRP